MREAFLQGFAGMGVMVGLLFYLALHNIKSAGYPIGGSLAFAELSSGAISVWGVKSIMERESSASWSSTTVR